MDAIAVEPAKTEPTAPPHGNEIRRETEVRFRRSGYFALRDISCDSADGVVYLRGCLPTYYLKQVAQAVAADIKGVRCVINLIRVIAPTPLAPVGRD